jgi:hypothetical protein
VKGRLERVKCQTELFDLVANKRCVIVAPSNYLKNRSLGEWIDDFDVVVKCNDFYEQQDDGYKDLGKRCDIWYGLPQQRSYQFDYEKCKSMLNPKHLRIQARHPTYAEFWDETMLEFEEKNNSFRFDYSVIDSEWYADLAERIGCMPMTGILAIFDLLKQEASQIHALGFDFMKSGYYNDYPIDPKVEFSGWHKNANLKEALQKLLMSENRFSCDSHLETILYSELNDRFDHEKCFADNFEKDCKQFFDSCTQEPVLMIHSSNRFNFETAVSLTCKFNEESKIHVISSSENVSEDKNRNITRHSCEETKLSVESISDLETLQKQSFQYCLIGYNGKSLFEYLNLFELLSGLHCSEIFLVSELGFLRKIVNPDLYVSEIKEFLRSKDRFNYLHTKYNRENCI